MTHEYRIAVSIKTTAELKKELDMLLEKIISVAYNHIAAGGNQADVTAKLSKVIREKK